MSAPKCRCVAGACTAPGGSLGADHVWNFPQKVFRKEIPFGIFSKKFSARKFHLEFLLKSFPQGNSICNFLQKVFRKEIPFGISFRKFSAKKFHLQFPPESFPQGNSICNFLQKVFRKEIPFGIVSRKFSAKKFHLELPSGKLFGANSKWNFLQGSSARKFGLEFAFLRKCSAEFPCGEAFPFFFEKHPQPHLLLRPFMVR
ncbi:MAG: hypothetical protein LBD21_02485 [Tannerellaceae bacterium]|jgi:hypothetical protein|nr:hypothetical protein [Tannerellaceae bacterium]